MRKICFLLIAIAISVSIKAQDFLGYSNSNYSGVSGIDLQPAAVVDSRYRVDITLVGFSASLYNNYLGLNKDAILKDLDVDEAGFKDNYLKVRKHKRDKSFYFSTQVYLPSFLITINRKNAFAMDGKIRSMFNVDGISHKLASYLYNVDPEAETLPSTNLYNKKLNITNMSWLDYGITYGHVFRAEGTHFFKGAATVKMLQGLQASYVNLDNMNYNVIDDEVYMSSTNLGFGYTDDIVFAPSLGFDFGAVYEWRPDYDSYLYDMDGQTGLSRRDKNKYKLRLGFSVLDIGSVKFKNANVYAGPVATGSEVEPGDLTADDDSPFGVQNVDMQVKTIKMKLPTAISAQVDYNVYKKFYVNFTPYYAFKFKNSNTKVHDISTFSLTPRWDFKWFGFYNPLSVDFYGNAKMGLGFRLGPLIFGTNNIVPLITNTNMYGADFHVLLKVPVLYGRPRDSDNDKVSNKKDKCRDIAGTWEFAGCPDKDLDHVLDTEDDCPDNAGLAKFKGCPDTDGDDIMDKLDQCPDKHGPKSNGGCPDLKLSLIDTLGNLAETVKNEKNGDFVFAGLPERRLAIFKLEGANTDTVTVVKVITKGGSELALRNEKDRLFKFVMVIDTAGKASQKEPVDSAVIVPEISPLRPKDNSFNKTIGNFDFAKADINTESYSVLDELVNLLQKNADWNLKIIGHTDNRGSEKYNVMLSQKRADAVKKYIIKKGIAADRLEVKAHGSIHPLEDNKTEAGRQKNRRVELEVINK